jgi:LacI family transcriptional regulator
MTPRRRPTLKDVAARAGVGTATVSRVLTGNGYTSQDARDRILAAAQELGYRPSALARGLKLQRTEALGLLVADITNPFYSFVAAGALQAASEAGHHLILCATSEDPKMESEYIDVLLESRVDGIVAVPTGANLEQWERALEFGVQVVLVDRELEGLRVPSVTVDNRGGAFEGTRLLLGLGHRRIAILTGPRATTTGGERLAGYLDAHASAGVPVDERLVRSGSFMREPAAAAARELLTESPRATAIFAANNVLGEVALAAINEAGLRIPDDISLLVFDDVAWTRQMTPAVTAIAQPMDRLGSVGVERLLDALGRRPGGAKATNEPTRLPVQVIVRDSCGPPPHD